ncbi:MAG: MotA/TolQ/ExbB proton channel family protein [Planctomycetota bacterium]
MESPYPNQLSGITGKWQWLLWFFVCLIGGCVLAGAYWFGRIVPWLDYMVIVIVALFLGALIKSFNDIRSLDREAKLASKQVKQLVELNDVANFLKHSEPSVFRSHIRSLHTIFLSDTNIQQDSLIEITHARLVARNKVVELLGSILITLGLIGTIIGLLISIGGLSGVLGTDASDMDALQTQMQITVSGLSTAFYTTLFGAIFGGVVLRILTNVIDANILRFMAHLSELTEVYVLPAMRRTAARLEGEGYYRRMDGAG